MRQVICVLFVLGFFFLVPACSDDAGGDGGTTDAGADARQMGPLEVIGSWVDGFGIVHRVTEETWIQGWGPGASITNISQYSNDESWVVGQNTSDHPWNPDKWNRFEWILDGDTFYMCQSVFDADTEDDALNAEAADPSDPQTTGCGGYPWSSLTEGQGGLAIAGSWESASGGDTYDLSGPTWAIGSSSYVLGTYSNANQLVVAQNDSGNAENPDLWSRFDWAWTEGKLFLCHTSGDHADADTAEAAAAADSDTPATAGCAGGAWTELVATE